MHLTKYDYEASAEFAKLINKYAPELDAMEACEIGLNCYLDAVRKKHHVFQDDILEVINTVARSNQQ